MKKFAVKMVEREILSAIICDRCGFVDDRCYPLVFSWNPSEEDEITVEADLCFDCSNDLLVDVFPKIAAQLIMDIPFASVCSPNMLNMTTGKFNESQYDN